MEVEGEISWLKQVPQANWHFAEFDGVVPVPVPLFGTGSRIFRHTSRIMSLEPTYLSKVKQYLIFKCPFIWECFCESQQLIKQALACRCPRYYLAF